MVLKLQSKMSGCFLGHSVVAIYVIICTRLRHSAVCGVIASRRHSVISHHRSVYLAPTCKWLTQCAGVIFVMKMLLLLLSVSVCLCPSARMKSINAVLRASCVYLTPTRRIGRLLGGNLQGGRVVHVRWGCGSATVSSSAAARLRPDAVTLKCLPHEKSNREQIITELIMSPHY